MIIGRTLIVEAGDAIQWTAGLAIDADGCPDAYAPPDSGLHGRDALGNAGHPGDWWALVTDTGDEKGTPIVQAQNDPCPGYYVTATALADRSLHAHDPRRYVDSNHVPYLAVPPELRACGVRLGDVAVVRFRGQWSPAIVADIGPRGKIGEGSIALARALSIPESPRHGGVGAGVEVTLWPGSRTDPPWPRTLEDIADQVMKLAAGK